MSKKISWPIFLIVCALLVVITFQITLIFVTNSYREIIVNETANNTEETWESKLDYINELTQMYFLKEIPKEVLEDYLPAAYIAALGDKYSYYMSKENFESYNASLNADMQGIGVNIVYNSELGVLDIISVVSGSPAREAGVKSGDLIHVVEGQKVSEIGYYEALNVMLGKAGTIANFSVLRPNGEEYEEISFSIERGYIVEESVSGRLHGDNVGIIRIEEFNKKTPDQFKKAMDDLISQGADRFVYDVRYNPGGDLDAIVSILDMLLPEGPVIRIIDRDGQESVLESKEGCYDYPMAVITNGSTASAAELFTSALRDYEKAVIIGEKTYGKGTMQSIIPLPDGSAVCMTTQTYCPPKSESYDGIGISPDVEVFIDEAYSNVSILKLTFEQDTQLQTAVTEMTK